MGNNILKLNIINKKLDKFYEYVQNNSGGSFIVNDNLCERLFIQANSAKEADDIAENLGVYFNGCEEGLDCDCCGDRWYSAQESENLLEFPLKHGNRIFKDVETYAQYLTDRYLIGRNIKIFYLNGTVKNIS